MTKVFEITSLGKKQIKKKSDIAPHLCRWNYKIRKYNCTHVGIAGYLNLKIGTELTEYVIFTRSEN